MNIVYVDYQYHYEKKNNRWYTADFIFKAYLANKNGDSYNICQKPTKKSKDCYRFGLFDGLYFMRFYLCQSLYCPVTHLILRGHN